MPQCSSLAASGSEIIPDFCRKEMWMSKCGRVVVRLWSAGSDGMTKNFHVRRDVGCAIKSVGARDAISTAKNNIVLQIITVIRYRCRD